MTIAEAPIKKEKTVDVFTRLHSNKRRSFNLEDY